MMKAKERPHWDSNCNFYGISMSTYNAHVAKYNDLYDIF